MKHIIAMAIAAAAVAICNYNTAAAQTQFFTEANFYIQKPAPLEQDTLTIALVGDIMMGNLYKQRFAAEDGRRLFDDPKDILRAADITCGNLEGTMADKGRPRKDTTSSLAYMFMMPPRYAEYLTDAGFDYVGIANNHIYDFYEEALVSTEKSLEKAGIGFSGAKDPTGANKHLESYTKVFKSKNGRDIKVGFCAFGHEHYSQRTMDTSSVRRIITGLKNDSCRFVIVCFHGGCEGAVARHLPYGREYFYGEDRGDLRQFTHLAVDCGADVVYGHGPHVVRAIECYKGKFIAYSLGNFCTVGFNCSGLTANAPLITVRIDSRGRFIDGRIHPFKQKPMAGPKTDSTYSAVREIAQLTKEDIPDSKLAISPDGTITLIGE